MSTPKPRPLTPLRDRRLTSNSSNSPKANGKDPVKSSILRESGLGWNSSPPPPPPLTTSSSGTSPLRIAKRDSMSPQRTIQQQQQQHQHPSQIARRASNTFKRLNNTNLVSKSPFKSQIPTPSSASASAPSTALPLPSVPIARKVSGEKRPRPISMHEQAETENDRPFAYKRERRQSKGYEGLIVKEPVTRSPFRLTGSRSGSGTGIDPPLPPLPPKDIQIPNTSAKNQRERQGSPSPGRSSLVSKRLHGPRLSGGEGGGGRRRRRKTVTFDEQCDVVEFDAEDDDDEYRDVFEHEYGHERADEGDDMDIDVDESEGMEIDELDSEPHFHEQVQEHEHDHQLDGSFESAVPFSADIDAEANDSITGMVNSMLHQANTDARRSQSPSTNVTPPRYVREQQEEEEEDDDDDNVPLGQTHNFERILNQRSSRSPPPPQSAQLYHQHPFRSTPTSPPTTPPQPTVLPQTPYTRNRVTSPSPLSQSHSPSQANMTTMGAFSPGSHIPLGRTTHAERMRAKREEEEEVERGVEGLEGSPSPVKGRKEGIGAGLVPKFGVRVMGMGMGRPPGVDVEGDDPFAIPIPGSNRSSSQQPHRVSLSFSSPGHEDASPSDSDSMEMDPTNLSFTGLEKELGLGLGIGVGMEDKPKTKQHADENVNTRLRTPESDSSYNSSASTQDESPSSGENETVLPLPAPEAEAAQALPLSRTRSSSQTQVTSQSKNDGESGLGSLSSRGSIGGRMPRISREDVQRRLMRKRSDSPVPEESAVSEFGGEEVEEGDGKRMSVMTDFDLSNAEVGTIETVVEKRNVAMSVPTPPKAFPSPLPHPNVDGDGLKFDLGLFGMDSGLGEGMGMSFGEVDVDMRSALDRLMDDVAGSAGKASSTTRRKRSIRVEAVTEGVKPGRFELDISMRSDSEDGYREQALGMGRPSLGRASTEPDLFTSTPSSRTASGSSIPPPPPPKDAIRSREQLILEKRREARRREEDESMGYYTPPKPSERPFRPARRRSRSTGDMEGLARRTAEGGSGMLDVSGLEKQEDDLSDSIQRELRKLRGERGTYHVKEKATIYASSDAHRIEHMESAGDVDAGKAWRTVRRPSDMNEYSKQIKEYRAQEKPGKLHGKVFVRVVGLNGINVPLPQQATAVTCTLNNGIHFVTTPECRFDRDSRIDQEFELIEHSKLEFTLTLKIRRDPHIITMFKAIVPTPPAAPVSKSGMRAFFSSPKKSSKNAPKHAAPASMPDNLARYLKSDGTLARAFISFKDIAARCDTKLFETSYPLIGQRIEMGGAMSTVQVGELMLQVFRLPPLPGIPPEQLPQSLEECHRGLRHINWHKMTYFEGTLTQQGGDCTTWRRRPLRVIGANLVAFNDVTKKATATIGLKKALAVEDDQVDPLSPASARSRYADEYDGLGGVERSFRLIFPNNEEIMFFADTDEEKAKWLEVLRALVGHIPPNPLWAELIWQRQDELKKQAAGLQPSRPALPPRGFGGPSGEIQ